MVRQDGVIVVPKNKKPMMRCIVNLVPNPTPRDTKSTRSPECTERGLLKSTGVPNRGKTRCSAMEKEQNVRG